MSEDPGFVRIENADFTKLLALLKRRGYALMGPVVRDGVIMCDSIEAAEDLPVGWRDEQDAGTYRLKRRDDKALFGYNVGPHSWKKFLFPPRETLWQAQKTGGSLKVERKPEEAPRYAFIGVRACEINAIQIQDKVFLKGSYPNPLYRARRDNAFIVAVNCGQAAGTCFCSSMSTGPEVKGGYDIALTEVLDAGGHYFVARSGSEKGKAVLAEVPGKPASEKDTAAAAACVRKAEKEMGRKLDTTNLKDLLYRNYDNKRWEAVAGRCLSCANCTMVCPTCFCSTVEDATDLTGAQAGRQQLWDSCFTMDFTKLHDISVRSSAKSRYRQWMTHKLAAWIDQFGTPGCVGCGRCIAWCPVGIDITEEAKAIRDSEEK
ncbi:MAG: 4Fe-4S dicluster domain-containing protein [Pseudomonadota bacterium]